MLSGISTRLAFISLLAFVFCLRLIYLFVLDIPLYGDEAQYWIWSEHLDFGYYSKPPGIALLIAASTKLFGDTESAIRLASPILHLVTSYLVYLISFELLALPLAAYIAAAIYFTMPGVTISSMLISTDPLLMLFWALGIWSFVKASKTNKLLHWMLLGAAVGCGLETKYSMGIFGMSVICYLISNRADREMLYSPKPYLAILIATTIFLPNVLWNINHGFVSLEHTADLAGAGYKTWINFTSFAKFLSEQFWVFNPVCFAVLLFVLGYYVKTKKECEEIFLLSFTLPFLIIISLVALKSRAHGNWAAPAYIAASIIVGKTIVDMNKLWIARLAIGINILCIIVFGSYDYILKAAGIPLEYKIDPLRRVRANAHLGEQFKKIMNQHENAVAASDDRLLIATLTYYAKPSIANIKKWRLDNNGVDDYFDMTANLTGCVGRDIILVSEYITLDSLKNLAKHITLLGVMKYPYNGAKEYKMYLLKGFYGTQFENKGRS